MADRTNDPAAKLAAELMEHFAIGHFMTSDFDDWEDAAREEVVAAIDKALKDLGLELSARES
jgi:hypothetical protein